MRKLTVLGVATMVVLSTQAAWGVSGSDPNDVTGGLDVKRSSVTVVEREDGSRRVRLAVTTYDTFDLAKKGSFYWQLDTWGGPDPDYQVFIFGDSAATDGPLFCLVQSMHGPMSKYTRWVTQGDRLATCGIRARWIKINKDIRYRLAGRMAGVVDRAPDTGWYS